MPYAAEAPQPDHRAEEPQPTSAAEQLASAAGQRSVRRVRLPADRRTPAAARGVVRSILEETGLSDLLDAALLLTTELSTNAVVHARTDLGLHVVADPYGLTVTVIDDVRATGSGNEPVTVADELRNSNGLRPPADDLSDRGRGLLLVDHFADRWGTTHYRGGKGVWFRLERADQPTPAEPGEVPEQATPAGSQFPAADLPALSVLLSVAPDQDAEDPTADFAAALLSRLVDFTGAVGGTVRCDLGEGDGPVVLARYGRVPRTGGDTLRVPLSLGGPASGELELDAPAAEYVRPLAALVAERLALALEKDLLRRADRRRQTWLTFLAEASELLAQSLDVELTLALIPQLVVPRLGQWSAVYTSDDWGTLQLETAAHVDEEQLPQLYGSLRDTGSDSTLSRLPGALRAAGKVPLPPPIEGFAVPLVARGQLLGTLAAGRHAHRRHEPDEVAVLQDVARRAALAVDNARIHAERRRVARALQRSLLPPALPSVPGVGFGAAYVPSGDAADVGGDFYDVVPMRDDRWLVVVGDVSGKGVQAATVTGMVREVIRALVRGGRPLPEILERLNETLVDRGRGRYCTLALASVGRATAGEDPDGPPILQVHLYLAGHEEPVLVRDDGRTAATGVGGTALGLLDDISSPEATVLLGPGDALIFYTDGVTERRRGRELFGVQRLRDAAAPLAGHSAEVMASRVRTATLGFSAEQPRDDIAVLVVRNELTPVPTRRRTRLRPIKERTG